MTRERKQFVEEITKTVSKIVEYLQFVSNTDIPIKNTEWTIGTAAAHLVISQQLSRKVFLGGENPYKNAKADVVSATNARLLKRFKDRNTFSLGQKLEKETTSLLKTMEKYSEKKTINTHFGELSLMEAYSYNLCHLLIHGSTIAQTIKKPLPIEPKHLPMILPFLKKAMLATYNKKAAQSFHGTFAVHLRESIDFAIICEGKNVVVTELLPQKVDCHIRMQPVDYFLLATGIVSQWLMVWDNKIFIWGRKPWYALKISSLFQAP